MPEENTDPMPEKKEGAVDEGLKGMLPRGSILGLYEVLTLLSKSGTGELYQVRNTITNKRYALKLLPRMLVADDAFTENFDREAKIAKQHVHPRIIPIHEAAFDQGFYYIVSEYVEAQGGKPLTLEKLLAKKKKLKEEQVRQVALGICEALEYAHNCPGGSFTHSDLKPSNILFDHDRELRVSDFDTIKLIGPHYVRKLIRTSLNETSVDMIPAAPPDSGTTPFGEGSATMSFKLLSKESAMGIFNIDLRNFFSREHLRELLGGTSDSSLNIEDTLHKTGGVLVSTGDSIKKEDGHNTVPSLLDTYDHMSPEQKAGETASPQSNIYSLGLILYRMLTGKKMAGTWSLPSKLGCKKAWDSVVMKCLAPEPEERYASIAELKEDLSSLDMRRGIPIQKLIPLLLVLLVLFVLLFAMYFARLGSDEQGDSPWIKKTAADAKSLPGEGHLKELPLELMLIPAKTSFTIKKNGILILEGLSGPDGLKTTLTEGKYLLEAKCQAYETLKTEFTVSESSRKLKFELTKLDNTQRRRYVRLENLKAPKEAFPWIIPDTGIEMLPIPAGKFRMGSELPPGKRFQDEEDIRWVEIPHSFWFSRCEITQREYALVTREHPSYFKGAEAEIVPVDNVSYNDAIAFCRKLNEQEKSAGRLPEGHAYRLPTEAEWEYCCRAGREGSYSFGESPENLGSYAWYDGNSWNKPHPVATKESNAWDICDMHGNVAEWCVDVVEKPGGSSGQRIFYVLRGGSWQGAADALRCSARKLVDTPRQGDFTTGLRIVLAPVESKE